MSWRLMFVISTELVYLGTFKYSTVIVNPGTNLITLIGANLITSKLDCFGEAYKKIVNKFSQ